MDYKCYKIWDYNLNFFKRCHERKKKYAIHESRVKVCHYFIDAEGVWGLRPDIFDEAKSTKSTI